jgi:hypothetical protein
MGIGRHSVGLKLSDLEADHSPPSSAEVKSPWGYTFISRHVFMEWYLITD